MVYVSERSKHFEKKIVSFCGNLSVSLMKGGHSYCKVEQKFQKILSKKQNLLTKISRFISVQNERKSCIRSSKLEAF